jgi:hypothetical protein
MRVKFLRAAVLALGLMGLAPLAVAQEGGFGSPSLLPVSGTPRLSSASSANYRGVSWQDEARSQDLPPPAAPLEYSKDGPAIGSGVPAYGGAGDPNIMGGYPYGASAWSGSCGSDSSACLPNCFDCCVPCNCGWFGGFGGLILTKGRDDFNQLSFNDADPAGALLTTQDSRMETYGGLQVDFGRWITPNWGVGVTYWGSWGPARTTTVDAASIAPNSLNTVFDFSALNIGATNVNSLYDDAAMHALVRSYTFHNVEISLFQANYYNSSGRLGVGLMVGPRWFRYREGFDYLSSDLDPLLNTGLDDVSYQTTTTNDLIGFQAGARINYQATQRVRLFAAPKFGIYNNHIRLDSRIAGPGGVAVVGPGNVFAGQAYDIHTTVNDVAFLGEIGVGVDVNITQYWALTVGYRAVTATGIAQPFAQIPQNFAGLNDAADINRTGSVLLHGAYAGVSYNF